MGGWRDDRSEARACELLRRPASANASVAFDAGVCEVFVQVRHLPLPPFVSNRIEQTCAVSEASPRFGSRELVCDPRCSCLSRAAANVAADVVFLLTTVVDANLMVGIASVCVTTAFALVAVSTPGRSLSRVR